MMPLIKPCRTMSLADAALCATAKQHAVRVDDRALAGAFERFEDVQHEGVVAILGRGHTVLKAAITGR
jgi:hypothetical protein